MKRPFQFNLKNLLALKIVLRRTAFEPLEAAAMNAALVNE
jgi:hypothetical protein